jgi:hypothetical protein
MRLADFRHLVNVRIAPSCVFALPLGIKQGEQRLGLIFGLWEFRGQVDCTPIVSPEFSYLGIM